MEYILADTNPKLVSAWREVFSETPHVKIIEGDITRLKADAIANWRRSCFTTSQKMINNSVFSY